jgi:hypothetical protein
VAGFEPDPCGWLYPILDIPSLGHGSVARQGGHPHISDLLRKHGAKDLPDESTRSGKSQTN